LVAGGADPAKVAWRAAHVGDADQAQASVAETAERFGRLDVLINNAGTNPSFGPMIDIDVARAQKTFEEDEHNPRMAEKWSAMSASNIVKQTSAAS
jgi:NAD(P)-dependent dehydrogenase (short-subunit alcohol dehydrogenase family)